MDLTTSMWINVDSAELPGGVPMSWNKSKIYQSIALWTLKATYEANLSVLMEPKFINKALIGWKGSQVIQTRPNKGNKRRLASNTKDKLTDEPKHSKWLYMTRGIKLTKREHSCPCFIKTAKRIWWKYYEKYQFRPSGWWSVAYLNSLQHWLH